MAQEKEPLARCGAVAAYEREAMILTVTMNPSIDTSYTVDRLVVDGVNRVVPIKTAGGKGLNVSRVLVQLGDDVVATGLLGGHMGEFIADRLDEDGVTHRFTRIAGESRVCISVLHEGNQTEFLESGPTVTASELDGFLATFRELLAKADCVTMSGSLPAGVPEDTYARMVEIAAGAGVPVLLDTSGASLDAALEAADKPALVKPNLDEVNGLLGTSFTADDLSELRDAIVSDGRFAGVPWVVVSMGSAGSVAFRAGGVLGVWSTRLSAVTAPGSGDSTIAGFAHAIAAGLDDCSVLAYGNACGKLNAMDERTGHLPMEKWDEVFASISVEELDL